MKPNSTVTEKGKSENEIQIRMAKETIETKYYLEKQKSQYEDKTSSPQFVIFQEHYA